MNGKAKKAQQFFFFAFCRQLCNLRFSGRVNQPIILSCFVRTQYHFAYLSAEKNGAINTEHE
jgi:hypothetical protein